MTVHHIKVHKMQNKLNKIISGESWRNNGLNRYGQFFMVK